MEEKEIRKLRLLEFGRRMYQEITLVEQCWGDLILFDAEKEVN